MADAPRWRAFVAVTSGLAGIRGKCSLDLAGKCVAPSVTDVWDVQWPICIQGGILQQACWAGKQ